MQPHQPANALGWKHNLWAEVMKANHKYDHICRGGIQNVIVFTVKQNVASFLHCLFPDMGNSHLGIIVKYNSKDYSCHGDSQKFFVFQVSMEVHATEWITSTGTSVPLKAHQWTSPAVTAVPIILSHLSSGSLLSVRMGSSIILKLWTYSKTQSSHIVFRSLNQSQGSPLWE